MSLQLLRDCRVAVRRQGVDYPLPSLSNVTLTSSISQVTVPRKTLFNKSSRPIIVEGKVNPTGISLDTILTTDVVAMGTLLELVGLETDVSGYVFNSVTRDTPELFELVITNKNTTIVAGPCYFESIDISMVKDEALQLACSISAANISTTSVPTVVQNIIYTPQPHTPINLGIVGVNTDRVLSSSISIQQVCRWIDTKNLFTGNSLYAHSLAAVEQKTLSANATVHYTNENINTSSNRNLTIGQSGLTLTIENALITTNFDLDSIYTARYDCYVTEDTGRVLITLES